MRKIAAIGLVFCGLQAEAGSLINFEQIALAVREGKALTFVSSTEECDNQGILGGYVFSVKPNSFMIMHEERIIASDLHFTLSNPTTRGKPSYGYSKYTITADGGVEIIISNLDANNFEKVSEITMRCKLNAGLKVYY